MCTQFVRRLLAPESDGGTGGVGEGSDGRRDADDLMQAIRSIRNQRDDLLERVTGILTTRLAQRGNGPPDRYLDDKLTEVAVWTINELLDARDSELAARIFRECLQSLREFEASCGCLVHKSDLVFFGAWTCLQGEDFAAAFYYLELLEFEHQRTARQTAWHQDVGSLMHAVIWNELELFETRKLTLFKDLWGVDFRRDEAANDWKALSDKSKTLYMVLLAQWLSYQRLKPLPDGTESKSFGLAYWRLIADLCRLLETEIRSRGFQGKGLNDFVTRKIRGPVQNFHNRVQSLIRFSIKTPTQFNTHFPSLRAIIENQSRNENWEDRIAAAAYLAGVTRNQVQHQVENSMIIFGDRNAAIFVADVLICLCRLNRWI